MSTNQATNSITPAISRRLEGKVAIITGASRGIGAVTARFFAQEGAIVVLAARNEEELSHLAEEIKANGGKALAVKTDVADAGSVERLVKQTLDTYGCLDAAFNNAGSIHRPSPLADLSFADYEQVIKSNLNGVFLAMKYEIPAMLASGGGAIVNMASTAGVQGVRGMSGYAAAKHGIIGLTKSAALEYARENLRINVVAPGPIVNDRIKSLNDETREKIYQAVPMHRLGQPEEIAATVAWLCSDSASFITGTVIPIDGGRLSGSV